MIDLNVFGPLVILRLQTSISVENQYFQVNPIVLNIVKWLTRHLVMDKKNNLTLRKSYSEFCWDVEKVFLDVNILDKNVVSTINLEVKKKQSTKNYQFKLNGEYLKLISR